MEVSFFNAGRCDTVTNSLTPPFSRRGMQTHLSHEHRLELQHTSNGEQHCGVLRHLCRIGAFKSNKELEAWQQW